MKDNQNFLKAKIETILQGSKLPFGDEIEEFTNLVPDGSMRIFFRVTFKESGQKIICIQPASSDKNDINESRSFHSICAHLYNATGVTPEIYGYDMTSGIVLCEDLGDYRLHDVLQEEGSVTQRVVALYEQTVRKLAQTQIKGGQDFNTLWCWDTPVYDQALMLGKESYYFLNAFCIDYLGLFVDKNELQKEFQLLAEKSATAPNNFFLHRDFQSRNIMVVDEDIRFIDFQGGRKGPLGYDLASLLNDPYAGLDADVRAHLRSVYFDELILHEQYDKKLFQKEYYLLALQRTLQIIGAFAFLTKIRKKTFFRQYLLPALITLRELLVKQDADEYVALRLLTLKCLKELER